MACGTWWVPETCHALESVGCLRACVGSYKAILRFNVGTSFEYGGLARYCLKQVMHQRGIPSSSS